MNPRTMPELTDEQIDLIGTDLIEDKLDIEELLTSGTDAEGDEAISDQTAAKYVFGGLSDTERRRIDAKLKASSHDASEMAWLQRQSEAWQGDARQIVDPPHMSPEPAAAAAAAVPLTLRQWWPQLRPAHFAMAAMAATIFVLATSLAFVWGKNSVLRQLPTVGGSVGDPFASGALQPEAVFALLQHLSNPNPQIRVAALRTGQLIGLRNMPQIAETLATTEPDPFVRDAARAIVLQGPDPTAAMDRVSNGRTLRAELGTPDTRRVLDDADAYFRGGAANGAAEAVRLYLQVLERLSPPALSVLSGKNLDDARRDAAARNFDEAAIRFWDLLARFRLAESSPGGEK